MIVKLSFHKVGEVKSRSENAMKSAQSPIRTAARLLASGNFADLKRRLSGRLNTTFHERHLAYGLRRDLTVPFVAPQAKIPITVREARDADAEYLFSLEVPGLIAEERQERAWRLAHFRKRIPTCYVAIDGRDGMPCYVQWLMSARDNAEIQALGPFPILEEDEALLENAYTPSTHRGLGIMPAAMALIAEKGEVFGARYVFTFVGTDNIPSLKGCERAGFTPHLQRTITVWLFNLIRRVRFARLPDTA